MSILDTIIKKKRSRVHERRERVKEGTIKEIVRDLPSPKDFLEAISTPPLSLIGEFKRASPSKGFFKTKSSPLEQARRYERGGARCISVLTEEDFFSGSLYDLEEVSQGVEIPVLAKDFFLTSYQIYEARLYGADAILLIVRALKDEELKELYTLAEELGLAVVLEIHSKEELHRVKSLVSPKILGINNRNLKTFTVDIRTTLDLLPSIPEGYLVISESGIERREEVEILEERGVHGILVGERLMTSPSVEETIETLMGRERDG